MINRLTSILVWLIAAGVFADWFYMVWNVWRQAG